MDVSKITNMKDDEQVLVTARNFWLMYLPQWMIAAFFILLAFFLMYPLFSRGKWGVAVFVLLNVIGLWHALRVFIRWRWNGFIVTSARIVDVDQRGFFGRVVSEVPFENIQDLSYSVSGVLGMLFNYGTVSLQTGSGKSVVSLTAARDPKALHHVIAEAMAARRGGSSGSAMPSTREEKINMLLDAASDLTEAEARSFLGALQQAIRQPKKPKPMQERTDLDKDLAWYKDEEK